MHHPSLQKNAHQPSPLGANKGRALILLLASLVPVAVGQAQFGRGPQVPRPQGQLPPAMTGQLQTGAPTSAEYQAFTAASSQPSASAQVTAMQRFIAVYPRSSLVPQARRLLASAATRSEKPQPGAMTAGSALLAQNSPTAPVNPQTGPGAVSQATQPAHRAIIDLAPFTLTIRADNSSLSQIFRDLSASTGLKVDGLTHDERIYGSFGPGDPHDVISALINGLGYNFLMLGESSRGVPRQLILSVQAAQPGAVIEPPQPTAGSTEMEEEAVQDDEPLPEQQVPGRSFVPPQIQGLQGQIQGPQGQTSGPQGPIRTTQQMLEELRQMHPPDEGQQPDQQQQPQFQQQPQ